MRRGWMLFMLAMAPLLGAGCGCGPEPVQPSFDVLVDPEKVSLSAGASAEVAVRIEREAGFAGAVTLSLAGAPAGLTGTFATNPVEGEQALLTVKAEALKPGTYVAYVKGTSEADRRVAALEVTVPPDGSLSVNGAVVDLFRQPVAGLQVRIGEGEVVTDDSGRFSLDGVVPPYDLIVQRTTPAEAHVFAGLTRPDPILQLYVAAPAAARTAPVSGTLSGGAGFPQGAGVVSAIFFVADQGFSGMYLFPNQGPGFGPFDASWYGDAAQSGTLYALQWSLTPQALPKAFLGFGGAPLSLQEGVAATGQSLALEAAGTGFLSGTVTAPSGFTLSTKALWLNAGPYSGVLLGSDATPETIFTYATPDVGLPVGLEVAATRSGHTTSVYRANLAPSEVIEVELPSPSLPLEPQAGATGVTHQSQFSWSAFPDAIHVAIFSSPEGADYFLYLAGTSAKLPDLTALGYPLARGKDYSWSVWGIGPFSDLDGFVSPNRGLGLAGLGEDVRLAVSAPRSFTTAP